MKLIGSGVANWAAIVRSPSFSRSAASTTTTNLPARMSSIASSIVAKMVSRSVVALMTASYRGSGSRPGEALDVFRQDVGLEIDRGARLESAKRRLGKRVRNERDREADRVERRDRQRDSVDGDRALLHAVAQDVGRRVDPDPTSVALRLHRTHVADPVDVPLDVVATERLAGANRLLEVHFVAEPLRTRDRLVADVESEAAVLTADDGE